MSGILSDPDAALAHAWEEAVGAIGEECFSWGDWSRGTEINGAPWSSEAPQGFVYILDAERDVVAMVPVEEKHRWLALLNFDLRERLKAK